MEAVEHHGVVESIKGQMMRVRIEQTSACAGCQAKKICSSADRQDKWVDIPSFSGTYQTGQPVIVTGEPSAGLKAVLIAYVIPLILMMAALAVSSLWLFPGKDGLAALVALSVTLLYYLILYPFRKKFQNQFVFTVRPFNDSSENGSAS